MNKNLKIVLFGFLVWLIPFAVSFFIYPLKTPMYSLFESIMSVLIAVAAMIFSYFYFRDIKTNFAVEGIITGIVWFIIAIVIDLVMFLPASPMHMNFNDYMMTIGVKYLIIPVVTIGTGYIAQGNIMGRYCE
ncbi:MULTISPECIES: hypothetical protein [Methanobacterium]|jgi:hypothetical protein|uniref:Uncharacterized protein n=1 Tax=Methanobacterium veterum TaxID=408577 RepID=A0A9E4ZW55_9EURY|nr:MULTISPECIES: hypothetical protein [Methanobacterium]MCZ3366256.1 hypothetical protein [Methanobacterium veterum]MCZ3371516.1 hypothetical protein [Methanobacterium veterum]